ncbi:MAG: hypothetical protein A2494_03730 [Candidatus Lloydbacteria bacterium RIFOXYC12_FULL_46_25]|uniref:GtrA/DPMS transmembrane domain-containing protein n=1 Tax=Candidatus Lloydbacteria bacterium RIFOXYC12_FULL_46_25 TaxID=1798670 RepID=A0A1G2E5I1_9BACT|nr:MAG: hypothetical protein A2494_03730 [Candidatus Lloydbacteria bacterium RIFOXYC12_FULL_46_25]
MISGGVTFVTNIVLLYVFTEFLHFWYLLSSALAFVFAFSVSFILQKFWTFDSKEISIWKRQLGLSIIVSLINLSLNVLSMYVLVEYVHIYYVFAQVLTSASIAVLSFFVYQHIVFVTPKVNSPISTTL